MRRDAAREVVFGPGGPVFERPGHRPPRQIPGGGGGGGGGGGAAGTPLAALPAVLTRDISAILAGTAVQLAPADVLLAVSQAATADPASTEHTTGGWALLRVRLVVRDDAGATTTVVWAPSLPGGIVSGSSDPGPDLFVVRSRAALFGYNAIDWAALPVSQRVGEAATTGDPSPPEGGFYAGIYVGRENSWADAALDGDTIWLDSVYPGIRLGSWLVLQDGDGARALFRVQAVREVVHADFALSAKVTEIQLDRALDGSSFSPKNASVLVGTEQLELAPEPIPDAVFGDCLELDVIVPELSAGQRLLLLGQAAAVRILADGTTIVDGSGATAATLAEGDVAEATAAPASGPGGSISLDVRTSDGTLGTLTDASRWAWIPAAPGGTIVAETAAVLLDDTPPSGPSSVQLEDNLAFAYDRATLRISANVAAASHGESVSEVLGSGDASAPFQSFVLKRSPLTYVAAGTETGLTSSLGVWANDVHWTEIETLLGEPRDGRVYVTTEDDAARTSVVFGDGQTGARLPTGSENVVARYRFGAGAAGRVRAGQLSQLLSRPLGLKAATNPIAAEGGSDAEQPRDARRNVPRSVLTLGRIVSLADFEDFAAAFPGIGKAQATPLWDGHRRIVQLTVAAENGAPLDPGGTLYGALVAAIDLVRDAHQPLRIGAATIRGFGVELEVLVADDHETQPVLDAVAAAIEATFAFDVRDFAEAVTEAELLAAAQAVDGVVGARVASTDPPLATGRITASPASSRNGVVSPAELVIVDPGRVEVREMPHEV